MKLTQTQVERLKRDAKRAHKANPNLTHSQALDAQARALGFANWSLLQKAHHEPNR